MKGCEFHLVVCPLIQVISKERALPINLFLFSTIALPHFLHLQIKSSKQDSKTINLLSDIIDLEFETDTDSSSLSESDDVHGIYKSSKSDCEDEIVSVSNETTEELQLNKISEFQSLYI